MPKSGEDEKPVPTTCRTTSALKGTQCDLPDFIPTIGEICLPVAPLSGAVSLQLITKTLTLTTNLYSSKLAL